MKHPVFIERFVCKAAFLFLLCFAAHAAEEIKPDDRTEPRMSRLFGKSEPYVEFFYKFKKAIVEDDRTTVASLIRYPITVTNQNSKIDYVLRTKSEFLDNYDWIINENVKTTVEKEDFDTLFVNWQGVMFGRGQVWYAGICLDKACKNVIVKVITISPGSLR